MADRFRLRNRQLIVAAKLYYFNNSFMTNTLFKINKLSCSYSHKEADRVLYVDDLTIPKGKITFLLGASGSGKSTLLETLGLMNDTFADGSVEFYPDSTNKLIRLEDLWYENKAEKLAEIRRAHFSFIFQNTNLMDHFTAYENICMAAMIQEETPMSSSIDRAKTLMNGVNIPESQVGLSTLSMHLSGGQRQRVTFVRALLSERAILFCDEPTGNLDEKNANELMRIIRESMTEERSVIIVSHDIQLAMKFADLIVCISKEENDLCSTIQDRNIFRRSDWSGLDDAGKESFKKKVLAAYDKVTDLYRNTAVKEETVKSDVNIKYTKLFKKKEGKVLSGKNKRNWWVITGLMFFTFIALGFANGALNYLDTKLKDPFVMWMTVSVPAGRSGIGGDVGDIIEQLNSNETRSQFDIKVVQPYSDKSFELYDKATGKGRSYRARSVMSTDVIIHDVTSKENLIKGGGFEYEDLGVICTQKVINELGLHDSIPFINFLVKVNNPKTNNQETISIPVPVRAIVKQLPGRFDLMVSQYFLAAWYDQKGFNKFNKSSIDFFVHGTLEQANTFSQKLNDEIQKLSIDSLSASTGTPKEFEYGVQKGYTTSIDFVGMKNDLSIIDSLGNVVSNSPDLVKSDLEFVRYYNLREGGNPEDQQLYDAISINLSSLSKVRELRDYVFETFNDGSSRNVVEIDISKVREKENFNFMSNMTKIISWLLILFSALCIGLFLFNLLKMHLSRVQPTLGTFKAFGLKDTVMGNIYVSIFMRFLGLAIFVSVILSLAAGYCLDYLLHMYIKIEEGVQYFQMVHINTLITLAIITLTTVSVALITIRNLLRKSPGDLIYNRK
jgi:ABC-type lipoprotein export system ATPase subunit